MRYSVVVSVKAFIDEMGKRNMGAYAGSIAFFFLLSMIPILILTSILLPLVGYSEADFVHLMTSIVPVQAIPAVRRIIHEAYRLSGTVLPMTLVALIWSCARGMLGLMYGLNTVYAVEDDRGYFHLRFLATVYMLLLIVLFICMLVLMVFGEMIQNFLATQVPSIHETFGRLLQFRYVIVIGAGVSILSLLYKLVPAENQPLLEQVPGACFTVLSWIIFSKLFSLFANVTTYSLYYGSLAVLILFMFWLYWCIYIILIGGYINWYFRYEIRISIFRIKERHKD